MLTYGINFVLILGLISDKFHYNNISIKGTVIFCSIELSDIWKLTQYDGPKNKKYTINCSIVLLVQIFYKWFLKCEKIIYFCKW